MNTPLARPMSCRTLRFENAYCILEEFPTAALYRGQCRRELAGGEITEANIVGAVLNIAAAPEAEPAA